MFTQEVVNLIPSDFSDHSKVWIFQCNRAFNEKEQAEVNEQLMQFYTQWVSHDERWGDLSINWEDDETAIDFTLHQTRSDGALHFPAGIAVVLRKEIDRIGNNVNIGGRLRYEREATDDNPFHGNLLLHEETPKRTMKLIAASIALVALRISPR